MSGWYLMHRGWMESGDFKPEPFTDREAYLWSIEQAAFEPHRQWFNGTLYTIGRGEFVTSLHAMMAAFKWSEKRVRGFTQRMVKAQKWAKRGANAGAKAPTLVTICNYDLFQAPKRPEGEARGEEKGERGAKLGRSEGEEHKEGQNKSNEGERIEEADASRSLAPALPFSDAIEAWSQIAAIKGWKPLKPDLTDKRRKGLGKVLSAHGLPGFVAALQRAADSEMLGGPDPPVWFNFTFVCSLENFTKLNEGNYDRSFNGTGKQQQRGSGSAWLDAREALSATL